MRKIALVLVASVLLSPLPARAQDEAGDHSRMQHYGGHGRHLHRDWSGAGGRGHMHNVCWQWNELRGWEWFCR